MSAQNVGPPALLEHPVWYEPLRAPAWLLPKADPSAPRIVFSAPVGSERLERPDEEFRDGLPSFLADAVRFSTVARATATFGQPPEGDAITAEIEVVPQTAIVVRISGPDDADLGTITEPFTDDASLGRAIGALPGTVNAALRETGVRAVWSTVFQPPPEAAAAEYVRAHEVCRWLRDVETHRDVPESSDETARRRKAVDAALRRLAELSGRVTTAFASLLFFAGLGATHQAGDPSYLGYRLSANGRCMTATDPRDPVFRISVLVFRMLGDPVIAGQRTRALAGADDPELHRWLARIGDVRSLA